MTSLALQNWYVWTKKSPESKEIMKIYFQTGLLKSVPQPMGKTSEGDGQVVQGAARPIWQVKQRWARMFDPAREKFLFSTKSKLKFSSVFLHILLLIIKSVIFLS